MSEKARKRLQEYFEFNNMITAILIELHKEDIEKHSYFKAFMEKWEKRR